MLTTCDTLFSDMLSLCKIAEADHNFSAGGVDWGFTSFMNLRDLLDPKKGYLVDDTLTVSLIWLSRQCS